MGQFDFFAKNSGFSHRRGRRGRGENIKVNVLVCTLSAFSAVSALSAVKKPDWLAFLLIWRVEECRLVAG